MANKEKITILIGILMLAIFLFFIPFSVSELQNKFNDTTTSKNFGSIGVWSSLTYIQIPKTATITNASLNITGSFSSGSISSSFSSSETVNITSGTWNQISIRANSSSGIHVVACDNTANTLYYFVRSAGVWTTELISSTGVGTYCDVALDSNNIPQVCYQHDTGGINYANRSGGAWSNRDVDTTNQGSACSIDTNSNNDIGITFIRETTDDRLEYVFINGTNGTNTLTEIDDCGSSCGFRDKLGLEFDTNNNYHVSYAQGSGTTQQVFYRNSTTTRQSVTTTDLSDPNAIALDSNNIPHIAYQNESYPSGGDQIRYSNRTSGSWSNTLVDGNGLNSFVEDIEIKIDSNNNPFIAYSFDNNTVDAVRYAYFNGSWNSVLLFSQADTTVIPIVSMDSVNDVAYIVYANKTNIFYINNGLNPSNVTLDVGNNGTAEFNATGEFSTKNKTDVTTELTSLVSSCTADASGFCTIPINISGTNGRVTIDAINITFTEIPRVNITYPINNSNFTSPSISINYTAFDANLQSCWWTNNSGTTNNSITCGTNISYTSEGMRINVTVYANDTDNNISSSSITFNKDSVIPSLTLIYPAENDGLTINTSIGLNFSVSDLTSGVQACWFNLDNGANTTITSCLNTTFNTSEGGHTAYIYANDTFGSLATDSNFFQISLTSPVIVLVYPNNNTYFNNGTNIYLNYTATDGNGLSSCQVWHDLNGTFSNNQTNNGVTSGQMNYTIFNISQDNSYKWNIFCNDTGNAGGFSVYNRTFTIDTTLPIIPSSSIDITTPVGGQSITINITSYTELNCNNSFYSVYDSSGVIENGISNRSLTSCTFLNDTFDVNDVPANTYNLTIYMRDKAGNENSTTKQFSTIAVSGGTGGGGGGGGTVTTEIPVIALQDINSSEIYTDLTKAILYATINNYCSNKINKEPLAVVDYSQQCQLTNNDLPLIIIELKKFVVEITEEDLRKFIENYKQRRFLQAYATEENIEEYNLFTSVLGETTIWLLTPPSIDSYFTIFNREGTVETLPRVISSNKPLKSCEVVSNTPSLTCEVTSNYTAKLSYEITDTNFFTKTFSGTILLTTDAEPERTEQRRSQVTFRVINFGSNTAIYSGIGTLGIVSLLIFVIVRKRKQKFSKQVRELISLK